MATTEAASPGRSEGDEVFIRRTHAAEFIRISRDGSEELAGGIGVNAVAESRWIAAGSAPRVAECWALLLPHSVVVATH